MGKAEEEQAVLPTSDGGLEQNAAEKGCCCCCCCCCCWSSGRGGFRGISKVIGLRCVLVLVLSVAVFLSAVFWLPPFLQFADRRDLDPDSNFKAHDIVASFMVKKPASLLEDNILQLENDILVDISVPSTKVVVLSLKPSAGSNITKVVFAVDPEAKHSELSTTSQSLVRSLFSFLVVNQSSFYLNQSLFGDPFFFEVLKFSGGITIIPRQNVFLLQRVQISFNFTLNFSIYELQQNFAELTSQLRAGLRLASYENLYITLSNSKGSTVAPPATVNSSILLTVGNPSMPRLKQLAQTISGHSRNLGLNNTVFGRVKQVRLSSILQHSLHGAGGSPAPAPVPYSHHHHQHHHHHHHHHHSAHLAPASSPAPSFEKGAPAPVYSSPAPLKSSPPPRRSHEAQPPGCQLGHKRRGNGRKQLAPAAAPTHPPLFSASSPLPHVDPPAVTPIPGTLPHSIPASSPLPNAVFAHVQPPSNSESDQEHSDQMPSVSPSPSPSSSSAGRPIVQWAFSLWLVIVLHI